MDRSTDRRVSFKYLLDVIIKQLMTLLKVLTFSHKSFLEVFFSSTLASLKFKLSRPFAKSSTFQVNSVDPSLPRFIPWLITASFSALLRDIFFLQLPQRGAMWPIV